MRDFVDFITSPDFAELGCWFLSGAITGGAVIGVIAGRIARRHHRTAMRSRQPQFLTRL